MERRNKEQGYTSVSGKLSCLTSTRMRKPKEKEATFLILQVVGYLSPAISFPALLFYCYIVKKKNYARMSSAYAVTDA
jgi:hypothetical protein